MTNPHAIPTPVRPPEPAAFRADTPALPDDAAWQPMPARSRLLFLAGTVPLLAVLATVAGGIAGFALGLAGPAAAAGLLLGTGYGAWLGLKQFRHTYWRLDAQGLALRRGSLWQRETRVPASRIQHLDIKHGPLQRGRGLATLVVHTAGTRNSEVTVPHLDEGDASHLREQLSARIADRDDD